MDNTNYSKNNLEITESKKGITGSTLKLIAIITMLIDHIAASIIGRVMISNGMNEGFVFYLYMAMRAIGRVSFPIFCFLLVEGFAHTRNQWKYALRLACFAVISEIPFDLAFYGKYVHSGHQNVFFTLLIGMIVMIVFQAIEDKARDKKWLPALAATGAIAFGCILSYLFYIYWDYGFRNQATSISKMGYFLIAMVLSVILLIVYIILCKKASLQQASVFYGNLAVLSAGMAIALLLKTDYSAFGILTIAVMYGLRRDRVKSMLGGCLVLTAMSFGEITSFFDLILAYHYNGKRGLNMKYLFYAFYPVHLIILYLICYYMGIA